MSTTQTVPAGEKRGMKVWEFTFELGEGQGFALKLPKDSRVLRIEKIGTQPKLFALVNPYVVEEVRWFIWAKTNQPLPTSEDCAKSLPDGVRVAGMGYAGGFANGADWIHVFEVKAKSAREPGEE